MCNKSYKEREAIKQTTWSTRKKNEKSKFKHRKACNFTMSLITVNLAQQYVQLAHTLEVLKVCCIHHVLKARLVLESSQNGKMVFHHSESPQASVYVVNWQLSFQCLHGLLI